MPYYTRYRRRRPMGRRPRSAPARRTAATVRQEILSLAETKHVKHFASGALGLTNDMILNGPSQGAGQNSRVGSKITVTGVYGKITARARNSQGLIRVVFYRPRDPARSLSADSVGVFNHIDMDSYVVYSDELIPLSNANGPDWGTVLVTKKFPTGLVTTFDDASTNIQDNMLRMYIVGWNTITTDETNYDINCYFKDM